MAARAVAVRVANDQAMRALGARLMQMLPPGSHVHLSGGLGAGKTTLVQGALAGLGWSGPVPSPTFTLIEGYELPGRKVCHCDFYRIGDPEELELLGIRDYFSGDWDCWVEWPERAGDLLPEPDLEVVIEVLPLGRAVDLAAHSRVGLAAKERLL